MSRHAFTLSNARLVALPSGALWLPDAAALCVSDLHFGKSERIARRGGGLLPPYETVETLERLEADIEMARPGIVICLGDSFDDLAAADALDDSVRMWINRLQAGRRWIWIEGNHDAGPVTIGGSHRDQLTLGPLVFRHIAEPLAKGEISGHYHPKHGLAGCGPARACFLTSAEKVILPAYGTYTGGLHSRAAPLATLFPTGGIAVMTGRKAIAVPFR